MQRAAYIIHIGRRAQSLTGRYTEIRFSRKWQQELCQRKGKVLQPGAPCFYRIPFGATSCGALRGRYAKNVVFAGSRCAAAAVLAASIRPPDTRCLPPLSLNEKRVGLGRWFLRLAAQGQGSGFNGFLVTNNTGSGRGEVRRGETSRGSAPWGFPPPEAT